MGSIISTFNYGRLQGWGLTLTYRHTTDGVLDTATVVLTTPYVTGREPLTSGIAVQQAAEYDEITDAIDGKRGALQRLADWLIESMRAAVDAPHLFWLPLPTGVVPLWAAMVDRADHTAADWYARYGDNDTPPPFEIVGRLLYVAATDELVPAGR